MSRSGFTSSGGVGFGGLLTILFIGLKLGGVIEWPWWWVLGPLWVPFAVAGVICLAVLVFAVTVAGIQMMIERGR